MVQNLKIAESRVFILKAFRLTLFKRIRQKKSEKVRGVTYIETQLTKKKKKLIMIGKRSGQLEGAETNV